jgi:hypothetical protein
MTTVIKNSDMTKKPSLSEPAMGPCLCMCEWVPGLVRKLQGTGAKVSDQTVCELVSGLVRKPDIQKNSIQGS